MRQRRPVSRVDGQSVATIGQPTRNDGRVLRQPIDHISDLTGLTFGRWTVGDRATGHHREGYFLCRCACGTTRSVRGSALRAGKSQSCGCLCAERCGDRFREHGHRLNGNHRSQEYIAWTNLKDRCENPKSRQYHNYGGRGITICAEWREDFPRFLLDMGPSPGRGYSIERKDVNGPYASWNCRWATLLEQARNRRTNLQFTYNGETLCLSQWAERLGMPDSRLGSRLRAGWSFERAILHGDARRKDAAPR